MNKGKMQATMKPEELKQHIASLYNGDKEYLASTAMREESGKAFNEGRFPTMKDEAWRHTDISPIYEHSYAVPADVEVTKEELRKFLIPKAEADVLVFVNGYFKPALSDIKSSEKELVVRDMRTARRDYPGVFNAYFEKSGLYKRNIFTAANTAYAVQGSFVLIKKGKMPERMVQIIHVNHPGNQNTLVFPRNLIVAESGSSAKIVESHFSQSEGVAFSSINTEVFAGQDTVLDYYLQQSENDTSYHINNMVVEQEQNSTLNYHALTFCGKLVRNQLIVNQNGEGCASNLHGLYLGDDDKHFDNHVQVNHMIGGGTSRQYYRGILDDASSSVYFGKVYVERNAQQTYSEQSNKNVLLKDKARANSKPQLEIYADDVSCAHGSTTGKLDQEALFYLRSRGLNHDLAQSLLLYAFAKDVVEYINYEPYKNHIDRLLTDQLGRSHMVNKCTRLLAEYANE